MTHEVTINEKPLNKESFDGERLDSESLDDIFLDTESLSPDLVQSKNTPDSDQLREQLDKKEIEFSKTFVRRYRTWKATKNIKKSHKKPSKRLVVGGIGVARK
ncbi:unnamed protein product [Rotaria magnacalcarata]|uniref:Uncharacterized protein n=1 Tax=Rotaria magnacalcarata TaxID=392030 RepID=A0A816MTN3_9BILA|nr:unnamed protein product [Rotaria magnacalcarata]CAF2026251.1 unnamed protein product [Rotaria magnacalcarata]CAF2168478.1 unnamed protein product [Rotaria magnacalcarata]